MKTSPLFTLDWKDAGKGLIMAVGTAVLTAIYTAAAAGKINWSAIGLVAAGTAITYLTKNFLTPAQTAIVTEGATIVSSLTASSTNPTMEDVHRVIAALTTNPAITINAPIAPAVPVAGDVPAKS